MQKLTRIRLGRFLKKYATSEKILDVGAGGSSYSNYFPNRLTVDIDQDRKPDIIADAAHLPFEDGSFTTVLSTEMLEHVHDPKAVLQELYRVLAPSGTLILTTRFIYPVHDAPGDYWRFTRPSLERLFENFSFVEIQAETGTFGTIGVLFERISLQTRVRGGKITKAFLLGLSRFFLIFDSWILMSYGDIKKSVIVPEILSSGYYVVAKK